MFDIVKKVFGTLLLLITAIEMQNTDPGAGAAKKAAVVAQLEHVVDPVLPTWIVPVVHGLAPLLIDTLVALANKTGFFTQLASA